MKPALCPNGCGELDAPAPNPPDMTLYRSCPLCGYSRPLLASEVASMGGRASSNKLTPEERSERAKLASRAKYDRMTDEGKERQREHGRKSARKRWGKE